MSYVAQSTTALSYGIICGMRNESEPKSVSAFREFAEKINDSQQDQFEYTDFQFDVQERQISSNEGSENLSKQEAFILTSLLQRPNETVTPSEIQINPGSMKVVTGRVKRKLGSAAWHIASAHRAGYSFNTSEVIESMSVLSRTIRGENPLRFVYNYPTYRYHYPKCEITAGEKKTELAPPEREFLRLLHEQRGEIVTHEQIEKTVKLSRNKSKDVIALLKKKINNITGLQGDSSGIVSIKGVGYMVVPDEQLELLMKKTSS